MAANEPRVSSSPRFHPRPLSIPTPAPAAPPIPPPQAALGGDGAPLEGPGDGLAVPTRSVTDFVGPTFEGEARDALSRVLLDTCPWLADDSSGLMARTLDCGGDTRQADVFGYVREKDGPQGLAPSISAPGSGLRVLLAPGPPGGAPAPAAPHPIPAGAAFSPYDARRMGPHKCICAVAYSGASELRRKSKLIQLETLLQFTAQRWTDRTGTAVEDITSLIAMAGVVFFAGATPRAIVLSVACRMVAAEAGPLVLRLMQAGRFFVMVLDKAQAPTSSFQCEVASTVLETAANSAETRRQMSRVVDALCAAIPKVAAHLKEGC